MDEGLAGTSARGKRKGERWKVEGEKEYVKALENKGNKPFEMGRI